MKAVPFTHMHTHPYTKLRSLKKLKYNENLYDLRSTNDLALLSNLPYYGYSFLNLINFIFTNSRNTFHSTNAKYLN